MIVLLLKMNTSTSFSKPALNIENISEYEIFRDRRNLYRAQICLIEGNLYVGISLFYFDWNKADWFPTRKNFHFPIAIWPAFAKAIPQIDKLVKVAEEKIGIFI